MFNASDAFLDLMIEECNLNKTAITAKRDQMMAGRVRNTDGDVVVDVQIEGGSETLDGRDGAGAVRANPRGRQRLELLERFDEARDAGDAGPERGPEAGRREGRGELAQGLVMPERAPVIAGA